MNNNPKHILSSLFELKFGGKPLSADQLPKSGSDRVYYRIKNDEYSAIGAFNSDVNENEAFFSFSNTFSEIGINVPDIYAISPDRKYYLISDLGNETLFDIIRRNDQGKAILCRIRDILMDLLKIQIIGSKKIDFDKSYPIKSFDRQSILWDLNYFKYDFLKLTGIPFNEMDLEKDFNTLAAYLLEANSFYFMYRDFQSRNIIVHDNKTWYIDYQGGRKGPLQYDLASLLYSPKTGLNETQREVMLEYYLNHLDGYIKVNHDEFREFYYSFVLIRILQALGAYGFRGIHEKKLNFRKSIPEAVKNLNHLFDEGLIKPALPEISAIAKRLSDSSFSKKYELSDNVLTIRITSFSYKNGIPEDPSENGGGFVFDCRGLPNPGRYPEYKNFYGDDKEVIDYLEQFDEIAQFQNNVRNITAISIKEYISRGFDHLCVNFGCTGGQHRSVYNAEKFAEWVKNNFNVRIVLMHIEKQKLQ